MGRFLVAISEREENGGAVEGEDFAEAAFEVAFVAPVEEAEIAAVNDEPWWASVGLDDIAEFGVGVFEAGGGMSGDGGHEDFV